MLRGSNLVGGRDISLYIPQEVPERHHDVSVYIRQHLDHLPNGKQQLLIERAAGLFLFAATVCEQLDPDESWLEEEIFDELMNINPESSPLDGLYSNILEQALPKVGSKADLVKLVVSVLQIVTIARIPVSIFTIENYLPSNKKVDKIVGRLGGVMKDGTPHRPIHILHSTFKEYLIDQHRSKEFFVQPRSAHRQLALQSLHILQQSLHVDISGTSREGEPFPQPPTEPKMMSLPEVVLDPSFSPIRYAIQFWADHVREGANEPEVQQMLQKFFENQLLYWVEWVAVLGLVPDALTSLRKLEDALAATLSKVHNSTSLD
jgi:hypothetical protein